MVVDSVPLLKGIIFVLEGKYYHAWERKQFGTKYSMPKNHGRVIREENTSSFNRLGPISSFSSSEETIKNQIKIRRLLDDYRTQAKEIGFPRGCIFIPW